jgi:hypothetical protein
MLFSSNLSSTVFSNNSFCRDFFSPAKFYLLVAKWIFPRFHVTSCKIGITNMSHSSEFVIKKNLQTDRK